MTSPPERAHATVRTITGDLHAAFLREQPSASFLQTPAWGVVKNDWRSESIGWYAGERLVGAGLVLYRSLPRLRRCLAYLPEGPVIDWETEDLASLIEPMVAHVKSRGAFGIRIGPPVASRIWASGSVKHGLADPAVRTLGEVAADEVPSTGARLEELLRSSGWRLEAAGNGFTAGQPRYVFQIPLAGRCEADILAGMNQQWRRNIKLADRAGVEVRVGSQRDLDQFHRMYRETAGRNRFTPRPAAYFHTMYAALAAEAPDRIRLYLAQHEADLVAAALWIRVGEHVWYAYGASTSGKREVRGATAVQWRMIQDALAAKATVYDLRGITDTLAEDDPHAGLLQFKVGTGGRAVEYVGEWTLPISRPLYAAFQLYLRRRVGA